MKHCLILLLFELCNMVCIFSQGTLQEFVIEGDDNSQGLIIWKDKGCTPDVGVIVFYTTISNLKFSMPDTPNRLKNVSVFDGNCYVLCVQPTDTKIGGIAQYSIAITAIGYKPMLAFMVSNVNAGVAQYFKIKLTEDWKSAYESLKQEIDKLKGERGDAGGVTERIPVVATEMKEANDNELNFSLKGVEYKNSASATLYLDNQLMGVVDFNNGFHLKYPDTKPGVHVLRLVWTNENPLPSAGEWKNIKWNGIINTARKKDFQLEYKEKKTGFGYGFDFELVK